jgi:hypothetical protein
LRPRYQHYYFGDYYAANYSGAGFYPSYAINSGRFGYDPIFAYNRWQHRQDIGWERRQAVDFENRRDHEDMRPARTWTGQGLQNASETTSRVGLPRVAALLDDLRRSNDSPQQFQPVDQTERQQFSQRAQEVQRLREERQRLETDAAASRAETHALEADTRAKEADTRAKAFVPAKATLPGSPIVARSVADLPKDYAAPRIHEAPSPDLKVEPTPRAIRAAEQPQQRTVNRIPLDQPQPQLQPKAERLAPPQRDNGPAGTNQDKQKGKDKN